jgi:glycosyltransferase involved in cell wall biosynthesis
MVELVSIIVPVHNKEKAKICIEHIKRQTYQNIELIQVDLNAFQPVRRNYGFKKSHGSLVLFLDEDEYLTPETIASCVKKFNEGFDIVGIPQVTKKVEQRSYVEKCISFLHGRGKYNFLFWEGTVKVLFFKRQVLDKIGLFDANCIFCSDLEILTRAFSLGYKWGIIDIKHGGLLHDETYTLRSDFRKAHFGSKSSKQQLKIHGLEFDTMKVRKSIVQDLTAEPLLIPGVFLTMLVLFIARRIPYYN